MELLRPRLLAVSEELGESELASLKFLSQEYVPLRKLEAIQNAQDLFEALREKGMIEAGNLSFLKELLYRISRIDLLVAHLGSSREEMERELKIPGRARVSAYRYLLFQLSEDVTKDELNYFKFLLGKELPKCRQNPETITMMLDIFIGMEKKGILGEDNLSILKRLCAEINISLLKKIEEYELNLIGKTNSPDIQPSIYFPAALRRVFSKLHFAVAEHRDLTAEGMRKTVDTYRCEDHKDKDCFVCCILSHGKKGSVYGVDGQEVPIQELTTSFTGHNCCSLAGKPKVFFIQACQGESFQKGVPIETDSVEQDSSVETDARLQFDCIPAEADFLLGMATLQDYVSYRSRREGTWYIQALCQHLEYSCPRGEDILTILTAVNQEVSKKSCSQNAQKQMPQPSFTLRKKLIFPVN
ncbi:caspase-8-like isoform X2 [Indicator indicator]|uniref:caspase-8-like isoform X2 n=1 Tax=Indicator indicator TaxID=1002788 RepID=UPI0023DF3AA4|nr:caspase-8-like isoform X2 [Indicator indicator]